MAHVVIGANYGDEGKGLMTDYLVRKSQVKTVVRFNGGAQAGHTVVTPEGDQHVFSHVGSGQFAGASTVLGKRFIVNPVVLLRELDELKQPVNIRAHSDSQVTTVYDVAVNQAIERARDGSRHGSCGLGINETVTRAKAGGFSLTFSHLKRISIDEIANQLERIHRLWVPERLRANDIHLDDLDPELDANRFLLSTDYEMHARVLARGLHQIGFADAWVGATLDDDTVFEGAQGLALDELMGQFPHVTRSLTGLPYAIEEAANYGIQELTPVYVTRSYATRHGNGLLPMSWESPTDHVLIDHTNVMNDWQGSLRFAPLHLASFADRVQADFARSKVLAHMHSVHLETPEIAVTCLDQIHDGVRVVVPGGGIRQVSVDELLGLVTSVTGFKVRYTSYGRTHKDVRQLY